MLKIKDNISWEEIEKIGFIAIAPTLQPEYKHYVCLGKVGMEIYGDKVLLETEYVFPRRVKLTSHNVETIDLLYKLIKGGFIEEGGEINDNSKSK